MIRVKVEAIKSRGDGLCHVKGKEVYVPFVWENEEIELCKFANIYKVKNIIIASSERVLPFCKYYTRCGGCKLQHINMMTYLKFKRKVLIKLFEQKGLNTHLNEIVTIPIGTRRRVEFSSICAGNSHWFGFNGLKSKEVVSIKECSLLAPKINLIIPALRDRFSSFNGDIFVTLADNGIDILLTGKEYPDFEIISNLTDFCISANVLRVSWRPSKEMSPETVVCLSNPIIKIADTVLELPSGCFLQPSVEGEKFLTETVLHYVSDSKHIADLFAGIGTFTLPVSKKGAGVKVSAFDIFSPAISALASVKSRGIKTFVRDLFNLPLNEKELNEFDAVIIDPPRAGAEKQVLNISLSNVEKIVYVSCNPATFVRDAKILTEKGEYQLKEVTPVDQFTYSPHTELVAFFQKQTRRKTLKCTN